MPKRNGSPDSIDEFFSGSNTNNDGDNKKSKQNNLPPSTGIAALVRSQPISQSRQIPSETKPNANSKITPMTTNDKNASTSQPNDVETPRSKGYESDFDDGTNRDSKKKHNSLPASKQRFYDTPRHASDVEVKASHTVSNDRSPRKEQYLPYLRPKNRRKDVTKPAPSRPKKSEAQQRLSSAQNEKLNELRSQISLTQNQLEKERMENRTLRLIQRREEKSLRNFEDQEYSAQKVAHEFKYEIDQVKTQIRDEKVGKAELQKEVDERDEEYRDQSRRMKFYEKLITHEDEYEEYEELRDRLKEMDKQIKKVQEKIVKQEKQIDNIEQNYRQEMSQHLTKRRELKHELDDQAKKNNELFLKLEQKTRQVDTMHIHLQRGGRRPSDSSFENLRKSRSFQGMQDTSPQFREKMLDYDKKRREFEKDKPKPPPLPLTPPPKPPRKKYIPSIDLKPKSKPKPAVKNRSPSPPLIKHEEKLPTSNLVIRKKSPVRRLSTPQSYDEDTSEYEEDIIIEPAYTKPRSPSPLPPPPPRITVPPPKPRTPSPSSSSSPSPSPPTPPPPKPSMARDFDDKWMNIFNNDKKEESKKDDLLSKLTTEEPKDQKPRTSMFTFEPSTIATHTTQKKPPPRVVTSIYDFEQAVINLHDGKPVTAQPLSNKTATDPFESSSNSISTKPTNRLYGRDNSFTKTSSKLNTFESRFALPTIDDSTTTTTSMTTTAKPNSKQMPTTNDKLQRPKVVMNAPKPVPNRTVVEEIEDFIL
ncbi:hypothetical protein I4U23_013984 [Adineta vaga]|nr:hypothetical protein I4U23_013984 [Adineta vaga]